MENTLAKNETEQTACETTECRGESASRRTFRPHADVVDRGGEIVVWLDVPGAAEDRIDVTVEADELTVHAHVELDEPAVEGDRKFQRREYAVGDYVRSFRLGHEVDRDRIDATLSDGVLQLVVPKAASAVSKKITVKAR